jgi:hypothetical protein
MWMAPAGKGFDERFGKLVGCSHMSGLCVRHLSVAGPDEVRGSDPNQFLALG